MSNYSLTIRDCSGMQSCDIVYKGSAAFVTKIMTDLAKTDALGSHLQNRKGYRVVLRVPRPEDLQKRHLAMLGPVKLLSSTVGLCKRPERPETRHCSFGKDKSTGDIAKSPFFAPLDHNMLWGELRPRLDFHDLISCLEASRWNAQWMDQEQLLQGVRNELLSYLSPRVHYMSETLDEMLFLCGFSLVPEWAKALSQRHVDLLKDNLLHQETWKTSLLRVNLTALWPCKIYFRRYFEWFGPEFLLTFGETADTVHEALGSVYGETHPEATKKEQGILDTLERIYSGSTGKSPRPVLPVGNLAIKELRSNFQYCSNFQASHDEEESSSLAGQGCKAYNKWVTATQVTACLLRHNISAVQKAIGLA